MRKIIYALVLLAVSSMSLIACAQGKASKEQSNMKENKKVLVAYFSRTGENYGVGNITKGNTQIVAEMIGPGIDGRKGMAAVFDGIDDPNRPATLLQLQSVERMGDTVWMRYKV